MPSNGEIVKDVVDQFQKIQAHMKNAKKENAVETYEGLKDDYLSLKAVLTSLGVNLTDIDKIKEQLIYLDIESCQDRKGIIMKVYDSVKKEEVEVNGTKGLIDIMRDGRQVDLYLKEKKSDADGYMSWDVEHWSSIDVKRFIRCYSLEGRVLGESTGHNIYDLENEFKPEEAAKIELS